MSKYLPLTLALLILVACTTITPTGTPAGTEATISIPPAQPTLNYGPDPFDLTPTLPPATYYFFEPGIKPLTG